ncbi:MAG TPA: ABC transporter permease [Acidimicrobiales bacterium]|nr:ABC transporter permease [Acidimicrobiales bacterium]
MSDGLRLLRHQLRYDLTILGRNRQARVFTIGMPIVMLVLFAAIFGNQYTRVGATQVRSSTYYVANLAAFAVVDAAFMALAIALVFEREHGILKRRRATPEPAWVVLASRALTGAVTSLVLAGALLLFGRVAYGASVPVRMLPALAVTVMIGTISMCSLGFAAATAVRRADAAQPVVTALTLPLFFASGIFIPWPLIPHWLQTVAVVAPVRHLAEAMLLPFSGGKGGAWAPWDLLVVAAWGVAGVVVAARRFSWSPAAAD